MTGVDSATSAASVSSGRFHHCALMGDGSVKVFYDLNSDGYLNPGFPVGKNADGSDAATLTEQEIIDVGYADATTEMARDQFFGGLFISETYFKGAFED